MNELNKVLLKKVAAYDLIISVVFISVGYLFLGSSTIFFLLGMLFSYINLSMNSFVTNNLLIGYVPGKNILRLLSTLFRILLVCGVGVIIISKSDLNFIIYIIGYTSQLLAIVLYGLNLKSDERK
ncbi:hypothetical protein J2Z44_000862 [Clostridium punense]|uniref:ATP synthase subunit I n=1 Tax=Clostridium punense TaxID=1054297 RepID=A0ABS4K1D1_9CLOT|nr:MULTISPECIES: hypothetical protein [Clostridium]EQB89297.1 hypothetical protein M918_20850 [Clostridium sp. BL8]MBP2021075.1 hypothetical protein [Clostridium punense]